MASITKSEANNLFGKCDTVECLKQTIKTNCHYWFDEDKTLSQLLKCYSDAKSSRDSRVFGTMLLDNNVPFIFTLLIHHNGKVELFD